MIIGGTFDKFGGKTSMIVKLLSKYLSMPAVNGGTIWTMGASKYVKGSLNIWMPNVPNEEAKIYPVKERGSILICSKVMRPGYTVHDAVTRIFKMNGNAVITITANEEGIYKFALVDALGNTWVRTRKIMDLARAIKRFVAWMKGVQRAKSNVIHRTDGKVVTTSQFVKDVEDNSLAVLCDINKDIADKAENEAGSRYFGNASTRCDLMFPSIKMREHFIYVSKRNVNKERLSPTDFVLCRNTSNGTDVMYVTDDQEAKPSVDTPIQLQLYAQLPNITCMIHGHAYIKEAPWTAEYWPCGDLREVPSALASLEDCTMCINLRNHGFLAIGTCLDSLETMLREIIMIPRVPGKEKILDKLSRT
ncbi:hypothetical protein DRQ25_10620 [Candidatus Fermentibacteria bacterium]|nr:MAG: hypothetical protein DRQ25_10620 [Candidatus Fermentibacteria bacterium]